MTALADRLPALKDDRRVEAAAPDGDSLVLRIVGAVLRVSPDAAHGRTVVWTEVARLASGETAAAALAARRWNGRRFDDAGLVMGLYVEGNALVLGRNLDAEDIAPPALLDAALAVATALGNARELVERTLNEERHEKRRLPTDEAPFIRV